MCRHCRDTPCQPFRRSDPRGLPLHVHLGSQARPCGFAGLPDPSFTRSGDTHRRLLILTAHHGEDEQEGSQLSPRATSTYNPNLQDETKPLTSSTIFSKKQDLAPQAPITSPVSRSGKTTGHVCTRLSTMSPHTPSPQRSVSQTGENRKGLWPGELTAHARQRQARSAHMRICAWPHACGGRLSARAHPRPHPAPRTHLGRCST